MLENNTSFPSESSGGEEDFYCVKNCSLKCKITGNILLKERLTRRFFYLQKIGREADVGSMPLPLGQEVHKIVKGMERG